MAFSSSLSCGSAMPNFLNIDANTDGVITRQEREQALRGLNIWYTNRRARVVVSSADRNDNGAIDTDDDEEINELPPPTPLPFPPVPLPPRRLPPDPRRLPQVPRRLPPDPRRLPQVPRHLPPAEFPQFPAAFPQFPAAFP